MSVSSAAFWSVLVPHWLKRTRQLSVSSPVPPQLKSPKLPETHFCLQEPKPIANTGSNGYDNDSQQLQKLIWVLHGLSSKPRLQDRVPARIEGVCWETWQFCSKNLHRWRPWCWSIYPRSWWRWISWESFSPLWFWLTSKTVNNMNLHGDDKLKSWLEHQSNPSGSNAEEMMLRKKDPKCRFMWERTLLMHLI